MGVVNTTYTFETTDTITSGKMNGIIDDTIFDETAVFGTTLEVASGKLKIRSAGITSNELASNAVITAKILDGSVTSSKILDGTITNLDINASAAIAGSKISPIFVNPSVISVNSSNNALRITQTGSGSALIVEDSTSPDATPFVITSTGNVGIGTNSPGALLDVRTSADRGVKINSDLSGPVFLRSYQGSVSVNLRDLGLQGSTLVFQTGDISGAVATERMRITSAGNVGIGKGTPSTALDVNGTVTATSFAGPITGNASSATILATGRTIALTGDVTGTTGSFNGSANVSAATTIANNAITTLKIADNNVTNVKIASGLDAGKITTGTLPIDRISDGAISSVKIADATITAPKLDGAQTGTAPIYGARAFGSIEFAATRAILTGSQNIATVTRDSDSRTDITFTTAMPNANYVVLVTYGDDTNYSTDIATYNRTTTGFSARHASQSAGRIFQFVVFG